MRISKQSSTMMVISKSKSESYYEILAREKLSGERIVGANILMYFLDSKEVRMTARE